MLVKNSGFDGRRGLGPSFLSRLARIPRLSESIERRYANGTQARSTIGSGIPTLSEAESPGVARSEEGHGVTR